MYTNGSDHNPLNVWAMPHMVDPDYTPWEAASIYTHRIVGVNSDGAGGLLGFAEIRYDNSGDFNVIGVVCRRRIAGSSVWGEPVVVCQRTSDYAATTKSISFGAHFELNGTVYVIFRKYDSANTPASVLWITYTSDNGANWSSPASLGATTAKVDNTHPAGLPAALATTNSPWNWIIAVGKGIVLSRQPAGLHNGRIIVPVDYRYTADTSGTSRVAYIACDSDPTVAANWYILGGLAEATAGNDGANENAIVECDNGTIYMNCRIINQDYRGSSTSTDAGATWATMTAETRLPGAECSADLGRLVDGTIYLAMNSEVTFRGRLEVYASADNGVNWAFKKTLFYGRSGYPSIYPTADDRFMCLYEGTYNFVGDATHFQYLLTTEFDTSSFNDPNVIQFNFNEDTTGAIPTLAPGILPYGTHIHFGIGAAGGTYGTDGVIGSGAAASVLLQKASNGSHGGPLDAGRDSCTWEFLYATTANGPLTTVLCTSASNITFQYGVAGNSDKMQFSLQAGGLAAVVIRSAAAAFSGASSAGVYKVATFVRDVLLREMRMYLNGVLITTATDGSQPTGTVASSGTHLTMQATHGVTANLYFDLRWAGGHVRRNCKCTSVNVNDVIFSGGVGDAVPADGTAIWVPHTCKSSSDWNLATTLPCTVKVFRVTHAVVAAADMLTTAYTRTTAARLRNIPATAPLKDPATVHGSAVKLYIESFWDKGATLGADQYGAVDIPPMVRGAGISTVKSRVTGTVYGTASASKFRGADLAYDTYWGWSVRHSFASQASNGCWTQAAPSGGVFADFVQNTGIFSLGLCVQFVATTSNNQVLFDTRKNDGTNNPGFTLMLDNSTGKLSFSISRGGGTSRITTAFAGPTITFGTRYFIMVRGLGLTDRHCVLSLAAYTGNFKLGTMTHYPSSELMEATVADAASTQGFFYGQRTDQAQALNGYTKMGLLLNTSITDQQVLDLANYVPTDYGRGSMSRPLGLGVGLGRI